MHIHILGICGTFMGGVALLARELGMTVSGSDANVYPPMSEQLQQAGITIQQGYHRHHLQPAPDLVVMGNAMTRGNEAVEYVLNRGLAYCSGPQWLAQYVLTGKWVIAVSGTHGKTTTSSALAWILQQAGLMPGFLIGGVPGNFQQTARLGGGAFFVIEADEYDTAFFDKRSKFVHYRPRTLVINNLEFDHADIFPDLAAIQTQFHHLVRTVPSDGLIIYPTNNEAIETTLARGCWSEKLTTGQDKAAITAGLTSGEGQQFDVYLAGKKQGTVNWSLMGLHNIHNALSAIAAARHIGVTMTQACESLSEFRSVKRRMEIIGKVGGVTLYDDFAHHPTAIATTLSGLRAVVKQQRILAIVELGSNTMRSGVHHDKLAPALQEADKVIFYQAADLTASLATVIHAIGQHATAYTTVAEIIDAVVTMANQGDHIVIMSNGGFDGIHQKMMTALTTQ